MDYKETIEERVKILPEQLRAFVLDKSWRKDAEKIGKQFNLNEEKYASFENEIFLVLLCFEPKNDFTENIKKELGMEANTAGWIAEDVDKNIFSKVTNELDAIQKQIEESEKPEETKPQNSVGQSFEQIILNQAKAMRPAVASPELGYSAAKPASEAPHNLPTSEKQAEAKPNIDMPSYSNGDPYREPIQ